jgi:hypothetical protein
MIRRRYVAAITPVVVGRVWASSNTALGPSSKSRCPDPSTNGWISRMSLADELLGEERRSCRRPDRRHNLDVKAVDSRAAQPADPVRRRLTRAEAHAQTRQRVLEAAADGFGEKGFRAASLSDVADRAGHTIGAVYSNFASKDELFRALMVERLRLF